MRRKRAMRYGKKRFLAQNALASVPRAKMQAVYADLRKRKFESLNVWKKIVFRPKGLKTIGTAVESLQRFFNGKVVGKMQKHFR